MTIFHNPTSFSKKILHESYIAYHFCDILSCVSRHSRKTHAPKIRTFSPPRTILIAKQTKPRHFWRGFNWWTLTGSNRWPSARQAVMENGDFVRYSVIFWGSSFSFSYTFPTSIKTLYIISSLLYLLRCTFLHKHNIVINISDSLTAYDRLYSITYYIKNVNKNIDKPLLFAYYYVTVLL